MTNLENVKRVDDLLAEAKVFHLTTVDGDKPKCRPVSFHMIEGDKIYFGVGDFKAVYKQIKANPNIEVCATTGSDFLRYYGKAVFDSNPVIAEKAFEILPMLKTIYNEQTGYKLGMFYLEKATAEFYSMMGIQEKIEF